MTDNEAAKRRELQLLFLRCGYRQAEAREMAADLATDKLDEWLDPARESAMSYPSAQSCQMVRPI